MRCLACGKTIEDDVSFCAYCGAVVQVPSGGTALNRALIIGALVLVLLVAAGIGVVVIAYISASATPTIVASSAIVPTEPRRIPTPVRATPVVIILTATPPPSPIPLPPAPPPPPSPTPTQPLPSPTPGPQKRLDATVDNAINVVDLATNATFKITEPGIISAAWSRDGSKVLVSPSTAREGHIVKRSVRTVNADGSDVKNIWMVTCEDTKPLCTSSGPFEAIWSPDGKTILVRVLAESNGLFLLNMIDGKFLPDLASSPPQLTRASATDIPHFWSVDGKWIITVSTEVGHTVFALEVNGNRRVPVSSLGGIKVYDERFYPWKVMDAPTNCPSSDYFFCP